MKKVTSFKRCHQQGNTTAVFCIGMANPAAGTAYIAFGGIGEDGTFFLYSIGLVLFFKIAFPGFRVP